MYWNVTIQILTLNPSVLFWMYCWCLRADYHDLRNAITALLMTHKYRYDRHDIDVSIWQFIGPKPKDNIEEQILAKY